MKKLNILFAILLSGSLSMAQSIPNPGFETWVNNGSYEDPQGWGTFNFMSLYGNPVTATKSTDAFSGTYAIRMESKLVTNNPNPAVYPDTIHTIYSGTVIPVVIGFPYAQRPTDLRMNYKYTPVNNSAAGVLSYLFKWNSTLNRRDTIAVAASYMSAATTYQTLTVPFVYQSTATPDTAVIYMSPIAYNTQNQIGSVLLADNIQFLTPTGIEENSNKSFLRNDGNGKVTIGGFSSSAQLQVFSLSGKLVHSSELSKPSEITLDLAPAVYSYLLTTSEGRTSGKIAILK